MESMAKAMIEVAKMQGGNFSANQDLVPILTKIDQRLEDQSQSHSAQAAINQAILQALQDMRKSAE